MKYFLVFAALWAVGLTIFGCWLKTQLYYRIGSAHLKVMLFGVTLRKVALSDIRRISKREPTRAAENWTSVFKTNHRTLSIIRYSGLRKAIVITPRNRYVFLADLEKAIKRVKPDSDLRDLVEPGSDTSVLEQSEDLSAPDSSKATT
jgi:hypothetical protein